MGYETRLYIVEDTGVEMRSNFAEVEADSWAQVFGDSENLYCYDVKGENKITLDKGVDFIKKNYASVIGMVELCKAGYGSRISTMDKKETDFYFYSGDNVVITDRYGEILKQATVEDVIVALKDDLRQYDYRRFKAALALLESIASDYTNPQVLFYGH